MKKVIVLLACAGCSNAGAPASRHVANQSTAQPGSASPLAEAVKDERVRMHQRLNAIRGIGNAIALSDLAKAQSEAKTLVAIEDPAVLPQWQPFLARIRIAAIEVVQANDIAAASKSAVALGALCGSCHQTVSGHASFAVDELPPAGKTLADQMLSHQWAAARMWDGLLGPSDDRWLQGARALSTIHIDVAERQLTLEVWTNRVRELAKTAIDKPAGDGRSAVFNDLLTACAGCHNAIRDR